MIVVTLCYFFEFPHVEALPTIKAYMESDRFKSFPFFGPFVHVGHSKVAWLKIFCCMFYYVYANVWWWCSWSESWWYKSFSIFVKDPDFKPIPVSYRNWMAKYPLDKWNGETNDVLLDSTYSTRFCNFCHFIIVWECISDMDEINKEVVHKHYG